MLSIKCPSGIAVALMFKYVILFVALQTETKGNGIFTDRLTDRTSDRQTYKVQTWKPTGRHPYRKTDIQTDIQ